MRSPAAKTNFFVYFEWDVDGVFQKIYGEIQDGETVLVKFHKNLT